MIQRHEVLQRYEVIQRHEVLQRYEVIQRHEVLQGYEVIQRYEVLKSWCDESYVFFQFDIIHVTCLKAYEASI